MSNSESRRRIPNPAERDFNQALIIFGSLMAEPLPDYKNHPKFKEWGTPEVRKYQRVYLNNWDLEIKFTCSEYNQFLEAELENGDPRVYATNFCFHYPKGIRTVEDALSSAPIATEVGIVFENGYPPSKNLIRTSKKSYFELNDIGLYLDQTAKFSIFNTEINRLDELGYDMEEVVKSIEEESDAADRIIDLSVFEEKNPGSAARLLKVMRKNPTYWHPLIAYNLDLASTQNPKIPRFSDIMAGIQRTNRDKERKC